MKSSSNAHFYIGTLVKAIGLKGELSLKNLSDKLDKSKKLDLVFLEINKQLTPFFVEKISFRKAGEAVLKIQDISTIEAAQQLLKRDVFAPLEMQVKQEEGFIAWDDLIGYSVIDNKYGAIGTIMNVLNYPQQDIFEIHFKGKEILLPAIEDFITKIDVKSTTLYVQAPDGLIDLYINGNAAKNEEE
jgi:16S rRNA processing protein RimM